MPFPEDRFWVMVDIHGGKQPMGHNIATRAQAIAVGKRHLEKNGVLKGNIFVTSEITTHGEIIRVLSTGPNDTERGVTLQLMTFDEYCIVCKM
jgi:hypothetical protein